MKFLRGNSNKIIAVVVLVVATAAAYYFMKGTMFGREPRVAKPQDHGKGEPVRSGA